MIHDLVTALFYEMQFISIYILIRLIYKKIKNKNFTCIFSEKDYGKKQFKKEREKKNGRL